MADQDPARAKGTASEVFLVALGLGLTSFGGPIAHLGYFERTYVRRRGWLSIDDYAGIVALCQMMPGPASSQVGFLIGLRRAGWAGAFAAWIGFTLPSALLMLAFAGLAPHLTGPLADAALHGLKLVAVAVVAQAVWSMGIRLCPDPRRAALALVAAAFLLMIGGTAMQLIVLLLGAAWGIVFCRDGAGLAAPPKLPIGRRTGIVAGIAFAVLLVGLPLAGRFAPHTLLDLAAIFYRSGALVFGGGHVVLPLLHDALVPEWVTDQVFLSGYGAAQAVPGPLFTFAAYLGAVIPPAGGSAAGGVGVAASAISAAVALIFLFLPGMLIVLASLPLWNWIGGHRFARGALAGINAAVVGILGAALYDSIWTSAILRPADVAIAAVAFMLLERWRVAPILIVALCVGASLASAV